MRHRFLLCIPLVVILLVGMARAEHDWPQWRGPAFNGSSDATHLPDALDVNKNLAWQTRLPGVGSATPVLAGDRIFVSCWDEQSGKIVGACISRGDGHIVW